MLPFDIAQLPRAAQIWALLTEHINGETLPKGTTVQTPHGAGRVVRVDPDRGETLVELEDGSRGWFPTLEVEIESKEEVKAQEKSSSGL